MATGARYSIGPLTSYRDPDELREWLAGARNGDRTWYAIGPVISQQAVAARLVREEIDADRVHPFRLREGKGFRYWIEKKPGPVSEAARADAAAAAASLDQTDFALLELLGELAESGELPCNEELAERVNLTDRKAAAYRTSKLERAGLITVARIGTMPGGGTAREITITSTGARLRSQVAGEKA